MDRSLTIRDAQGVEKPDRVAVEEPLQITVDGHPLAVVMRTPGQDADLVSGFLLTEGIVPSIEVIRRVDLGRKNHAHVFMEESFEVDLSRLQRNLYSASSCGICGKESIDAVMGQCAVLDSPAKFPARVLMAAPDRLRASQETFEATGGLHAVGLFDSSGSLLVASEDVGRHNAVDKVVGSGLERGVDLSGCFLMVSGRVSFEIMQKAWMAGIPMVAAISAPSSLAIEFAVQSGQTLVAFLRPPKFNLYVGELL